LTLAHDPLDAIERAVSHLPGIPLGEVGPAELLDRLDRKYLMPVESAVAALRQAKDYRVLEAGGRRLGRYRTQYYDTADLALYHAHHSGQLPRSKVRIRSYLDSGARYLEVKRRTNRGRTEKSRSPLSAGAAELQARLEEAGATGLDAGLAAHPLSEALSVDFTRLTLVATTLAERVTVDVGITVARGGAVRYIAGVAVVEIKQPETGPSQFADVLRSLGFREGALSKYCMGIALLEPSAKRNRFQPVLRRIERMGGARPHSTTTESEAR
jgi:hypothetical protein